ncbi:hypothetical protein MHYP_G00176790 [Metynnis hypsauchen]
MAAFLQNSTTGECGSIEQQRTVLTPDPTHRPQPEEHFRLPPQASQHKGPVCVRPLPALCSGGPGPVPLL